MNELAQRLAKIIKQINPSAFKAEEVEILRELEKMEEKEILQDVSDKYKKVSSGKFAAGDANTTNSIVLYRLGVTTIKPSKQFHVDKRRTYGRDGFPDIDMDFCYERRHEILEYLIEKYGRENVSNIGTVQTLKSKAALRRSIKVIDPENSVDYDSKEKGKPSQSLNFALQNEILNTLPKDSPMRLQNGKVINTLQEAYDAVPEFRTYMDTYKVVFEVAKRMEGNISAYGSHAAGFILSPIPLNRICPLHVTRGAGDDAKADKTIATQFTMNEVESLGLIKFDILGLSTKTAISMCVDMVKQNFGEDVDLANLPLDDQLTLNLLNSGATAGCFQLENRGMQQTLMSIGIDTFDDLVISVAMYRPGPKDYIPELSERKRGTRNISYAHPLLEKITKRTYGIIAYQEQVMQAFMSLANLTATQGYTFMKVCAKKKPELIEPSKEAFFKGCEKNNIPIETVNRIWTDLEKFSGYAFNKSHSVSYAYEAWKTAYLKAHYPVEFIASRLSVESRRRNQKSVDAYTTDARSSGVSILPVDINRSKLTYIKTGERELLSPLILKDVGDKAAAEIIKHQPYDPSNLVFSFTSKVGEAVNTKVIEALIAQGIFGKVKKSDVLRDFETIRDDKRRTKGRQVGDITKPSKGKIRPPRNLDF